MARLTTSFVLGYHGCEREIGEAVVSGGKRLKSSESAYHWLGAGTYFWEADPRRALEWAEERPGKRALKAPFVLGAVIDTRNCLDLRTREDVELVKLAFQLLKAETAATGLEMPVNQVAPNDKSPAKVMRYLDFAVVDRLHQLVQETGREAFDTVRALFAEGEEIYPGSGFREKTHSEIAVRNDACIIGFFRPRENLS
ncbi:MAG: hypothetical protein ABI376_11065 [Caulobacteraceae bacterium]